MLEHASCNLRNKMSTRLSRTRRLLVRKLAFFNEVEREVFDAGRAPQQRDGRSRKLQRATIMLL